MTPRRELVTLVTADLISNLGSRISVVAIPWLVLETTGSPAKMGLVAFAETLPYLLSSALATPWADRIGLRRTSILADLASAALMVAVALTPWLGFGALVALVAVVGGLRGIGDRVKHVLFRPAAEAAGVRLIRLTSVYDGLGRLVTLSGAAAGGLLVWWFGVTGAILIDAATFGVCALLIGALVRPPAASATPAQPEGYLRALAGGFRYLGRDRTLLSMLLVIAALNMVANASIAVYIPLWVADVLGNPAGLGLVLGAFSAGALLGNLLFTVLGPRLPRYLTFVAGALLSGTPRLVALALSEELPVVLVVTFLSGIGIAAVNPLLGVALYERVPAELQTRVIGLAGSLGFVGLPVGALLGGWSVAAFGLGPALLAMAAACLLVTLLPLSGALRPEPAPAPTTP
ncbi:MFS transporter [Micromonospora sp. C28SCA-DRY-2]|uniref:MFS transporter n=1 Tax=Micromonospora sp. C28SCA-DRY-2 TaxID=3059522 RepID=UPI00267731EA|nr:MFS transporter [Micromonospora sp. C28SCA-DRY-2]MDO3705291.1 MFS transporter [Micromonospora sp. C28SCA-DRY-2]